MIAVTLYDKSSTEQERVDYTVHRLDWQSLGIGFIIIFVSWINSQKIFCGICMGHRISIALSIVPIQYTISTVVSLTHKCHTVVTYPCGKLEVGISRDDVILGTTLLNFSYFVPSTRCVCMTTLAPDKWIRVG